MKRILIAVAIVGVIGAVVGYTMWNKPHTNMESAKADFATDAVSLFDEFSTDEAAATAKYAGKTVAVSGQVKESSTDESGATKVYLQTNDAMNFGIQCELDPLTKHARTTFTPGETVTMKGECAGFNMDVQLTRCVEGK